MGHRWRVTGQLPHASATHRQALTLVYYRLLLLISAPNASNKVMHAAMNAAAYFEEVFAYV